jgi:hypothetical protein
VRLVKTLRKENSSLLKSKNPPHKKTPEISFRTQPTSKEEEEETGGGKRREGRAKKKRREER